MNLEVSDHYFNPIIEFDPLELEYHESWPLLQDLAEPACEPPAPVDNGSGSGGGLGGDDGGDDGQNKSSSSKSKKSKTRKNVYSPENEGLKKLVNNGEEISGDDQELDTSMAKKLNHNAKERIRRTKINTSYLALRDLLPDNYARSRSKKRWSAPVIVDCVLNYIPDLEKEIEALELKKENYITQSRDTSSNAAKDDENCSSNITVSVNEVKEEEAIIQICMENGNEAFTKLMQKMEDEQGICIQSASTVHVSQNRFCYHLHIQQASGNSKGATLNYVEGLRDKVTSWLQ